MMCIIVLFRCFEDESEEFYELPLTHTTNAIHLQNFQMPDSLNERAPASDPEDTVVPIQCNSDRVTV